MVYRMSFGAKFLAFQVCLIGLSATLHAANPGAQRSDPPAHLHENSGEFAGRNFRIAALGTHTILRRFEFQETDSGEFILESDRASTYYPIKFFTPENQTGYNLSMVLKKNSQEHTIEGGQGSTDSDATNFSRYSISYDSRETPSAIRDQVERYLTDPATPKPDFSTSILDPQGWTLTAGAGIPVQPGTGVNILYKLIDGHDFRPEFEARNEEEQTQMLEERLTPDQVRAKLAEKYKNGWLQALPGGRMLFHPAPSLPIKPRPTPQEQRPGRT